MAGKKQSIKLRDVTSLTGTIQQSSFTIRTSCGEMQFPLKEIARIHFQNPPLYQNDEIWLHNTDKFSGEITGDSLNVKLQGKDQIVALRYDTVHTVMSMQ